MMRQKSTDSKIKYVLRGEAKDQETIVRLRPWCEDHVRERKGIKFDETKLTWNMNDKGNFNFKLVFHG